MQRFGLFSYWRASNAEPEQMTAIRQALAPLQQKVARPGLLLVRE